MIRQLAFALAALGCAVASACGADPVIAQATIGNTGAGFHTGSIPLRFDVFEVLLAMNDTTRPLPNGQFARAYTFGALDVPAGQIGTIEHRITAADDPTGFPIFARELTDGNADQLSTFLWINRVGGGRAVGADIGFINDSAFRPSGSPSSNVDLKGFEITAISRRVELLNLTPLNGGTGVSYDGSRVVVTIEGRVPEPSGVAGLLGLGGVLLASRRNRRS